MAEPAWRADVGGPLLVNATAARGSLKKTLSVHFSDEAHTPLNPPLHSFHFDLENLAIPPIYRQLNG